MYPTTYNTAITKLREHNIFPSRVVQNEVCIELEVYCIALLMDNKLEEIKNILGDKFKIDRLPNLEVITIKIK